MKAIKFDFWQGHSLHYLEMVSRSDRREKIEYPDGNGKRIGECGDTVEMFLSVHQRHIHLKDFIV